MWLESRSRISFPTCPSRAWSSGVSSPNATANHASVVSSSSRESGDRYRSGRLITPPGRPIKRCSAMRAVWARLSRLTSKSSRSVRSRPSLARVSSAWFFAYAYASSSSASACILRRFFNFFSWSTISPSWVAISRVRRCSAMLPLSPSAATSRRSRARCTASVVKSVITLSQMSLSRMSTATDG